MQYLGFHEPRVIHAEYSHGHGACPVKHEELIRLYDVLQPVEQHNREESLQRDLVPARVDTRPETGEEDASAVVIWSGSHGANLGASFVVSQILPFGSCVPFRPRIVADIPLSAGTADTS